MTTEQVLIVTLCQLSPFGFWIMRRARESQEKEDVAQVGVGVVRGFKTALNYKPAGEGYYFGNHYICSYSHVLNISLDYIPSSHSFTDITLQQ